MQMNGEHVSAKETLLDSYLVYEGRNFFFLPVVFSICLAWLSRCLLSITKHEKLNFCQHLQHAHVFDGINN